MAWDKGELVAAFDWVVGSEILPVGIEDEQLVDLCALERQRLAHVDPGD